MILRAFVHSKAGFWVPAMAFLLTLAALSLLPGRPALIYVNETGDSRHDLALKQSLLLATRKSGAEFALVRKKELPEGEEIKAYATRLFQELRVGERHQGRGVLLLFSEKERLVKIEVSYPLEAVLTDLACRGLERAAASYYLTEVPQDTYSELLITLSNAVRDGKSPADDLSPARPAGYLSGGAGVLGKLASRGPADILAEVRQLPAEERRAYAPSDEPRETLRRYLESLRNGLGDPGLPLLTPGSQLFRLVVPRSLGQVLRISRDYARAGIRDVIQRGSLVLVTFAPESSTLPIVLSRDPEGFWHVDEPKSWIYFHRFENSTDFFLLTDDNPFRERLLELKWPNARCTIFKKRFSLPEANSSAVPSAPTGDWYLFEAGWLSRARDAYQSEKSIESRWKLFHVLMNLSEAEGALQLLSELNEAAYASGEPLDKEIHEWAFHYRLSYLEAEQQFAARPIHSAWLAARRALLAMRKEWRDLRYFRKIKDPCLG